MEDKLQKSNPILIVQAITKLISTIKEKRLLQLTNAGRYVYECDFQELHILKLKCGDVNPMISITACQGLVQLVEEGILPSDATLSDLIINLTTSKCCTGITMTIGSLLLIDMRRSLENVKIYNSPFGLQKNQHPFIKVLIENQSSWLDIFTQMQAFVNHFDERISLNGIEFLRPVFFFVLCKPTNKLCDASRQHVWKLLCSTNNLTSTKLVFQIISCFQLNTKQDVLDVCDSLQQFLSILKMNTEANVVIILFLTSLIVRVIENGNNPLPYINTILKTIDQFNDITHSIMLIMLSECIDICPPIYLKEVLKLCSNIILNKNVNVLSVNCVVASLLYWIIYPSVLLNESFKYAKDILDFSENMNEYKTLSASLLKNFYYKHIVIANPKIDDATKLCLLGEKWQNNNNYLIRWLNNIIETNNVEVNKLFNFISSIFIYGYNSSDIRRRVLDVLLKIVEVNKEYASKLLILIFFKLSHETDPYTQVALLKVLPKMAVLKDNVPLILTILETLKKETGILKTLSLTLYLNLFLTEVRTFPYLQNILLETNRDPEFSIVKVQILKDICKTKPELHGKEMVRHLAQVLNKNIDQKGSIASSLAIDGITSLCESGIIDIVSTWSNLSPKFSKEKRTTVVNSLCNFFAGFADVRTISKEHEKLKSEAIDKLWYYVSYNNNPETVNLALNALSKFNIDDIFLKQLPDLYRQKLILPKTYAKTPEEAAKKAEEVLPYIPGECWVQMLQNINHDAMEAAGNMLAKWIHFEISEYRSGVYIVPEGKTEPENYNYLPAKSVVRGIGNAVKLTATGDIKIPLTNLVLIECLRVLGQTYPKPLPPLNWCFLHDLLHKDNEIKKYCINLACKQIIISGSALRLIENYIETFEVKIENIMEIQVVFSNLGNLCQALAPNMLRSVITNAFQFSYEMAIKEKSEDLFIQLTMDIKNTFLNENIHEANRTLLGQIVEIICEQIDGTSHLFEIFSDCIVEAPSKFIERITSPSLWWETTKDKFERAVIVRCKIAKKSEKTPFVSLNECINIASKMKSVQIYLLKNIMSVFQTHTASLDSGEWILELLGQIQQTLIKDVKEADEIICLCDVFLLAVIVLVGHECYLSPVNQVVISKEERLNIFPNALIMLIQEKCYSVISQVLEWLFHMVDCKEIPLHYRRTFYQTLLLLRHEKAFIESSKWMKYMSVKYPN